jgi:hypothetical protein
MDASTDRRAPGLREPEFSGPGCGLSAAAYLQLAVNVADVFFYRADGHDQVLHNLLIGITGRDPPQDFQLAFAEGLNQGLRGRRGFSQSTQQVQGIEEVCRS